MNVIIFSPLALDPRCVHTNHYLSIKPTELRTWLNDVWYQDNHELVYFIENWCLTGGFLNRSMVNISKGSHPGLLFNRPISLKQTAVNPWLDLLGYVAPEDIEE